MSEVTSRYSNGTPSWTDLTTRGREAAVRFYTELFGWQTEVGPAETGYYTICSVRGLPVAGIGELPADNPAPVAWTTYLAVDDLDETVDKVKNASGTVLMGPVDVMDQGRLAVAADPTGAVFGMWQAGKRIGAQLVNEPGAMCWNEIATRDPAAARDFYRAVFGFGVHAMEGDFDYTELQVGGRTVAGLMPMMPEAPADMPPHWMTYFAVSDADAAATKARQSGGAVVNGPFDSPFGRIAILRDPQGGVFSVIALAEQA